MEGRLTRQPVGPLVDTATITTVMNTNRVGPGRFSSRCCTFRRTHTSANPIRLLFIRLALPLTLSLPSGFAPSARPMICVPPRALWLAGAFMCDCTFWDEKEGGLIRQPVGPQVYTATITTVMNTNCVESGTFSSLCCALRRRYIYKRRPYSANLYPTCLTLDSLLALRICAPRKTHGLRFIPGPMTCGGISSY